MSDDAYEYEIDDDDFEDMSPDEPAEDGYYYYYYDTDDDDTDASSDDDGATVDSIDTDAFYPERNPNTHDNSPYQTDVSDDEVTQNDPEVPDKRQPNIRRGHFTRDRSHPTAAWTESELKKGFLTSQCQYAPRVPLVEVSDMDGFTDIVTQHLDWRKHLLSTGQSPQWDSAQFMELLHEWATYYDHVRGKWMLFASPQVVDALWSNICQSNESGMLGGYCEVRPQNRRTNTHFIAVYCNDFNNVDDCQRVLHVLYEICTSYGVRVTNFKPDFLTTLGVYKSHSDNVDCKFTHSDLNISDSWTQPHLKRILANLYGYSNDTKKRNGRRKRPRRNEHPVEQYHTNPYASPYRHYPSRPNGRWSEEEEQYTWLVHIGQWAPPVDSLHIRDSDGFTQSAQYLLEEYRNRVETTHVSSDEKRSLMRNLYSLADRHDFVCGKWKVFVQPEQADELWASICEANDNGELGGTAKVSAFNWRSGKFLICVYCNDFRNVADCERTLYALHEICKRFGVRVIANFKADFLSHLGVYTMQGNRVYARYPLNELKLLKHWPNEALKKVLDKLKREVRAAA